MTEVPPDERGETAQTPPVGRLDEGNRDAPTPVLRAEDLFAGRFRIVGRLGSGATAEVYRARDELVGGEVALKVFHSPVMEEDSLGRVRREVRFCRGVQHPGIARLFDFERAEGRCFLVMEYCPGGTLRAMMKERGAIPTEEVEAVARQILGALGALHSQGVVHRDVKPENVFFGRDGTLKLGDFGLVKGGADTGLTQTGIALGTPLYVAPEVVRGERAAPASDLYALGVTLFEMLSGEAPFKGDTSYSLLHQQVSAPPPIRKLKERKVPARLRRFVSRLLEKRPGDRHPDAGSAMRALDEGTGRFFLPWRRRRLLVVAFVLCAAATVSLELFVTRRPAGLKAIFTRKTVDVRDSSNRPLWSRTLPREIQSACAGDFGPGGTQVVACATTWDEQEIILEESSENVFDQQDRATKLSARNQLFFFDSAGTLLKQMPVLTKIIPFPMRYDVTLAPHRFGGEGRERLVAVVSHVPWYPSWVFVYPDPFGRAEGDKFSASAPLQVYNSGHFLMSAFEDVDGDGWDEILFTAINNRLYRMIVAGFVSVRRPTPPNGYCSPDVVLEEGSSKLDVYTGISFRSTVWTFQEPSAPGTARFASPEGRELTLDSSGRVSGGSGQASPEPATVRWINDQVALLCKARDMCEWSRMLALAEQWPRDVAGVYGWLGRLFRAEALLGLGRYREVEEALFPAGAGRGDPDAPPYAHRFSIGALFLDGRYREALSRFSDLPREPSGFQPEMCQTVLWAALYAGEADVVSRFIRNSTVNPFTFFRESFPALLDFGEGDWASAERRLRAVADQISSAPGLWLAECLLRQGKTAEARACFEDLKRRYPEDRLEDRELSLWLRWREGLRDAAILAQLDDAADAARRAAVWDVEARAWLPVTLDHAATAHREAGDVPGAERLRAEARRLAPPAWAKLVAGRP